jgi:hypothetical protein
MHLTWGSVHFGDSALSNAVCITYMHPLLEKNACRYSSHTACILHMHVLLHAALRVFLDFDVHKEHKAIWFRPNEDGVQDEALISS